MQKLQAVLNTPSAQRMEHFESDDDDGEGDTAFPDPAGTRKSIFSTSLGFASTPKSRLSLNVAITCKDDTLVQTEDASPEKRTPWWRVEEEAAKREQSRHGPGPWAKSMRTNPKVERSATPPRVWTGPQKQSNEDNDNCSQNEVDKEDENDVADKKQASPKKEPMAMALPRPSFTPFTREARSCSGGVMDVRPHTPTTCFRRQITRDKAQGCSRNFVCQASGGFNRFVQPGIGDVNCGGTSFAHPPERFSPPVGHLAPPALLRNEDWPKTPSMSYAYDSVVKLRSVLRDERELNRRTTLAW